jgi:hypothetical protein
MSVPYAENIFEVNPSITSWRGHQILCIRSGHQYNWFLSLQKAKVLIYHLDKVNEFVSTSGSTAYSHFDKKGVKCPVLMLDNTITEADDFYEIGFGLHKLRLFIYWLPYVQKFAQTEGQECTPD